MRPARFESRRSATILLLVANVVAFLLECIAYGYPPRFHVDDPLALSWWGLSHGYVWQLFSFQFLHAGFLHLFFNGWMIYVFGRRLEEAVGVRRFLVLYFTSGVVGGLVQGLAGGLADHFASPFSPWLRFAAPTVGASAGGVGLLATFAVLYPEEPLTIFIYFFPVTLRAKFFLLFTAAAAVFGIFVPMGSVADAAHLGGILSGVFFGRYALQWDWHWPHLRRTRTQPPRRLVKVGSGAASRWGRTKTDDDLPPDEFLSKAVDPILDKISAQGIQSLTERERRVLEAARERMRKR